MENKPFRHKENRGSLFTNDRKEMETHPDFKGSALINGEDYYVSMWTSGEESKTDFSLAFIKKSDAHRDANRQKRHSQEDTSNS